jgi:signal transduction histidine kinase/ligand-binding sensor domain-containing protein
VLSVNFLVLLLATLSSAFAQPEQLRFMQITSEEGLSSSLITSIIQDHKGLVWVGTPDGLNRYDGFNFILYKNNPLDPNSLRDNIILTLFEDKNRNLFIGTENGLSLYDRNRDCFRNLMFENSSPLKGIACDVAKITEDSASNLWLATTAGLIYFDRLNNRIERYVHNPENDESLSNDNVQSVFIDKLNRVWVTTRAGLNLFTPESKIFRHINSAKNFEKDLSNIAFSDIAQDHSGDIWFGSADGLFCLKNESQRDNLKLILYQNERNNNKSLSINLVRSLFVDKSDNLWVGTENGGLNLFNRADGTFWHYRKDDYDPQSLKNESIESICQDKTGNLWFGTLTGLNIAIKNRNAIIKYQNMPGAPFSLSHNTVTCFLEDHKNKIIIGTIAGGLNLFDDKNGRFRSFNMDNSNLSSNSVLCAIEDSGDHIWLGTWDGGLVEFDPETGSFKSFTTRNSGIQDNMIFSIAEGYNNDLWLGSNEHGLIHYLIKENRFINYTPQNSNIGNALIFKILKYSGGRFLVGNTDNFQIFSPADNHFTTFAFDSANIKTLSYSKVTDILVDNDSCIWIGTPNGLNRFNPERGSFTRYYEKDGLPNNFIHALILDNSNTLWVTTNGGVGRFDYKNNKFKNFTKSDGLQSNEFFDRSILKTKKGAILMGGTRGFNIIYPEKIIENKSVPDILITDFKIFNKSVKPGSKNSPLVQNITETKSLTLPSALSVITFSFAVMDFSAPEENKYAYKMENFDKDWIYPEKRSDVTYTSLDPGHYVFRVKGSNNDGVWNEEGTSIYITILPPWWDKWWFKMIIVSSVILLFTLFFLSRLRRLKYQKILLEETVAEKTAELKELNTSKDKFFSIIAHDLKNPFSTIIGFSELLKEDSYSEDPAKTREFANMIYISAVQTFRLLENLLEWANSQHRNLSYDPRPINVVELIKEEFKVLGDMAIKKDIELKYSSSENLAIYADRNMIKTILRNLISNAIKFTPRNGKVEILAFGSRKEIGIQVSDNGIGMSRKTIENLFRLDANQSTRGTENENGTGLGLFLCKEFIEKHGGKIWAESEPGKGSAFTFILPSGITAFD